MAPKTECKVKFLPSSAFHHELKRRVDAWFDQGKRVRDGGARLVVKSLVILAWLFASYGLLISASAAWQALLASMSLGLAVSAVGFNIMHDGGHGSFSRRRTINRLAAFAVDLVGGSSWFWHHKHNRLHHHSTNIAGIDEDIEAEPWFRFSPSQQHRPWHRIQHIYGWLWYSWLPAKWHFFDDYRALWTGRVGASTVPRPQGRDLAAFFAGKAVFTFLAIGLPLLLGHSVLGILGCYALFCVVNGVTMAVVFQLAHCVEEAEMFALPEPGSRFGCGWTEHQLATTVDFCPGNRFLGWFVGGLNYQIEHHLFPRVSHVHYPDLAPIVRQTCAEFGVPYRSNDTLWQAIRSHGRFLARMGRSVPLLTAEGPVRPVAQPAG